MINNKCLVSLMLFLHVKQISWMINVNLDDVSTGGV